MSKTNQAFQLSAAPWAADAGEICGLNSGPVFPAQNVERRVAYGFLAGKKKAPTGAFLVLTVLLFLFDSYLLQFLCLVVILFF